MKIIKACFKFANVFPGGGGSQEDEEFDYLLTTYSDAPPVKGIELRPPTGSEQDSDSESDCPLTKDLKAAEESEEEKSLSDRAAAKPESMSWPAV